MIKVEQIDLQPLIKLKLHIEKLKADHEIKMSELTEEYESKIKELTEVHKERLAKSGELYDVKNNITLEPIYANREVDTDKLFDELPDNYWKISHLPSKYIVEVARDSIENDMKTNEKESYRKLAEITIKDAKTEMTERDLEDYWLPRIIVKYDLDLKIK